jgi:hypothetical protein
MLSQPTIYTDPSTSEREDASMSGDPLSHGYVRGVEVWNIQKSVYVFVLFYSSILAQLISRPLRGTISNAVQVHGSAWPATPAVVMLEHPYNIPAYNRQQQPSLPSKQLRVCWANVGRSSPWHITILEVAFQKGMDVVYVQALFTCANSRTSTHSGVRHLAPISTWDTANASASTHPRMMTYIRKGYHLKFQARESLNHPDLLWAVINGTSMLNCYRQPLTPDVLQYVTHLTPPPHCLVGGDFNAKHESFEPTVTAANVGVELARWAAAASMDYIGAPGQPKHYAGHVIDLTFSNVPFAQFAVDANMHSGSDHKTIATFVPASTLGTPHLDQYHYRVSEASLLQVHWASGNRRPKHPGPACSTGRSTTREMRYAADRGRAALCTANRQA